MTLEVKRVPLVLIERAAELQALLDGYAIESGNQDIGPVKPDLTAYRSMEQAGVFYAFGAYVDAELVGFLFLLTPVLPHYSQKVAVVESYFVAPAHRKTGAGTKLRNLAEQTAMNADAKGILFSAPTSGVLEQVLHGVGYRDVARMFFKGFK